MFPAYDDDLTEAHLIEAGVKSIIDRIKIVEAYNRYKKLLNHDFKKIEPTAPCESPVEEVAASAPLVEPTNTITSSECVICLDTQVTFIVILYNNILIYRTCKIF